MHFLDDHIHDLDIPKRIQIMIVDLPMASIVDTGHYLHLHHEMNLGVIPKGLNKKTRTIVHHRGGGTTTCELPSS